MRKWEEPSKTDARVLATREVVGISLLKRMSMI